MEIDVDALAQEIRRVDGRHDLGAGALAEALLPRIAALTATPQPQGDASLHPDDEAVDLFAAAMKKKLAEARVKGRGGWDGSEDLHQRLSDMLRAHVSKGDPRDVANFACFLWNRGENIAPIASPSYCSDERPCTPCFSDSGACDATPRAHEPAPTAEGGAVDDAMVDRALAAYWGVFEKHGAGTGADGHAMRAALEASHPAPAPDVARLVEALGAMLDEFNFPSADRTKDEQAVLSKAVAAYAPFTAAQPKEEGCHE